MHGLIYAGNGADSQFFSKTVDDYATMHVTSDDYKYGLQVAFEYDAVPEACNLVQGFWRRDAEFMGYYLARQRAGRLVWRTKKGKWSRWLTVGRQLFEPGDNVAELLAECSELVVVALWKTYPRQWKQKHFYPAIVYLGNGADSEDYESLFADKQFDGMRMHNGMGSNQLAVTCKLPKTKDNQKAYNCFYHSSGDFTGFYARKRTDEGWLWYGEDGQWYSLDSQMREKHLFLEGDDISSLFEHGEQQVVLEAQWQSKIDGRRIAAGYPMYSNQLMAHGLGGYDGKSHCNCLAGFKQAMENGYQYFETDIHSTSDGRIVLYHGWFASDEVKAMTYDEMVAYGNDGQPLMDARQLYLILKEHPLYPLKLDLYNFKGEIIQNRIRALLADFDYDKTVLDRLLVQVHTIQMMKDIDVVYPFKHYQILANKDLRRLPGLITDCLDYGVCAIGMRMNLAKRRCVEIIKAAGLYVMCFTVSKNTSVARRLLDSGVDTLCTDYITVEDLKTAKDQFGRHPFFVYYNSGIAGVSETYSSDIEKGVLDGTVVVNDSGTLEFKDNTMWENDGQKGLLDCQFQMPGKRFAGWNLRIKRDDKQLWLATDGCYHNTGDVGKKKPFKKRLLMPGEKLPIWTMQKGIKYIMTAVWKKEAKS